MTLFIAHAFYVLVGVAFLAMGCCDLHRYIRVRRTEKDGWSTLFVGVFSLINGLCIIVNAYF